MEMSTGVSLLRTAQSLLTGRTIGQIYPTGFQLNTANSSDTEAPFLDLNLSITNDSFF